MPDEPDTPRKKKPRKDQGQSLLRWSGEELELIMAAADKADQPLPVWLRRTVLRAAGAAMGVSKTRLRGNVLTASGSASVSEHDRKAGGAGE